ncbi:MAG TPA: hypothetical protein VGM23_15180 [Armatimonadota bacterium]
MARWRRTIRARYGRWKRWASIIAAAGRALPAKMHAITRDFAMPDDVCNTYRALYAGLQELEQDIHQHIHLENNVLFPRVRGMLRTCACA